MSFGFRVWVAVGLVCASMAARAEYKETWNPPEAAQRAAHVDHPKHAASAGSGSASGSGSAKGAQRHAATHPSPHAKVAEKPAAKKATAGGDRVKTAHASGSQVPRRQAAPHAKPAVSAAARKPAQEKPTLAATTAQKTAHQALTPAEQKQTADAPAPQPNGNSTPRELPPILK